MFYAVRLCGNPSHERYMRPIEFITEDDSGDPLERKTIREIKSALKGFGLYEAGWVRIVKM